MKQIILLFTLIYFQSSFAQENCPAEILTGKWKNEDFGIEIQCDKIVLLEKNNRWVLSKNETATYTFIKPYKLNEDNTFISWVKNPNFHDVWKEGEWEKVPSVQFRIFKLKLEKNGNLKFSMTEKKVTVKDLPQADWNVMKDGKERIFEKTFILMKFTN